jgi:hypothetical protein
MCEVADMLGISFLSVLRILKETVNVCQLLPNFCPTLLNFALCEFLAKRQNDCFYTPTLLTEFSMFFLLPKLKVMLKGRRFNDSTMIQIDLWDGPAKFQTMCYTVCLTVAWSLSSLWKSQGDCFEGNNIDLRVNAVVMEK